MSPATLVVQNTAKRTILRGRVGLSTRVNDAIVLDDPTHAGVVGTDAENVVRRPTAARVVRLSSHGTRQDRGVTINALGAEHDA